MNKSQGGSPAFLSNLGLKFKNFTRGVFAFVLNLGEKLKKSQGVSPAFLSNLGKKLKTNHKG